MHIKSSLLLLLAVCLCGAVAADSCLSEVASREENGLQLFTAHCPDADAVSLRYRLGFETDGHSQPMNRGVDGSWSVSLSPPTASLIRWSVATYASGKEKAAADGAPVVALISQAGGPSSSVPTLHWFVKDPAAARSDAATTGMLFFDAEDGSGLRSYQNVSVHRTGSERHDPRGSLFNKQKSKDWAKTNYRFTFHKSSADSSDDRFIWTAGMPAVKSIETFGYYQESGPNSYMRKVRGEEAVMRRCRT